MDNFEQNEIKNQEFFTDFVEFHHKLRKVPCSYMVINEGGEIMTTFINALKALPANSVDRALHQRIARMLREILFSVPPYYDVAKVIQSHPDLIYPEEMQVVIQAEHDRKARTELAVEAEIQHGLDSTLARVIHNERSIENPYVVGFYQDQDGKIRELYGPRRFASLRRIENDWMGGRTPDKEVNLLRTQALTVKDSRVQKGPLWDAIPEDLRTIFEEGKILVTSIEDDYAIAQSTSDRLAVMEDPGITHEFVEQTLGKLDNEYRILFYSDFLGETTGRTGVLVKVIDGEVKPVLVTVDGKEMIIELKGCGSKGGGFKDTHARTGRTIVTGGAEEIQAKTEFEVLAINEGKNLPQIMGIVTFKNEVMIRNEERLGYIIRASPSTVRASYTGNSVYVDIESFEEVRKVIDTYAELLGEMIFGESPRLIDASSHTENVLCWGNGETTFTDYSDQVLFGSSSYPGEAYGSTNLKSMLNSYLNMVVQIPGFNYKRDKNYFFEKIAAVFLKHGSTINFTEADKYDELTEKIWNGGMAYQVFKSKREAKYRPVGIVEQIVEAKRFWGTRRKMSDIKDYGLMLLIGEYLKEEVSIINAARNACPESDIQVLEDAKREVAAAMSKWEATWADEDKLRELYEDPNKIIPFLALSYYQ